MKPEKVCEISLKFQPPNTISLPNPIPSKINTRFSLYYPSFSLLSRLIIILLFKKLVGTSIQN
jgi:hypothetical protein